MGASEAAIRDYQAHQPLCFEGKKTRNPQDNARLNYYQDRESVILFILFCSIKQINMTVISLINFSCLLHSQALLMLVVIVQ